MTRAQPSTLAWSRDTFALAIAQPVKGLGIHFSAESVYGYVLSVDGVALWGLHRPEHAREWSLTHVATGGLIPGGFRLLADGKRFAEELSAEVDCAIVSFGKTLRGVRGVRAFAAAVKSRRALYGFNPVRPMPIAGVVYGAAEGSL